MERKYNRKVMIAKKPMHSHNRGPNHPDLDYFNDKLFGYIISDNVLEHIGYHDQSLQNFYHILHKGGLLIFSLPGENTMHGTFKSKKDVHILRKNKEMHSLLRKIGLWDISRHSSSFSIMR